MKIFIKGLGQSLVIAMGYIPVAIAFGVTSVKMGLDPIEAIMASILVFAGASQFMLVALWNTGTGIAMASLIMFLINLRHIFYGPSLFSKTKPEKRYLLPLISFGITDEVYATSLVKSNSIIEDERLSWTAGLETGAYLSWISGTAIGAILGDQILKNYPVIESTLSFALPALFLSLFLSIYDSKNVAMLAATAVPVIVLQYLGFTSAAVIAGIVSGITSSALFGKKD
ncbi:AzlC family ABC transporter permease [Desulforegula conservatrix]|uniref:AzlC family ABC transporter permease n=1 Tax=Desulforegula conservatrix TaxID=153026 RepID=UPI000429E90A|nr:AzlC family ABC transporter permease [Desulforegula conservatrix]